MIEIEGREGESEETSKSRVTWCAYGDGGKGTGTARLSHKSPGISVRRQGAGGRENEKETDAFCNDGGECASRAKGPRDSSESVYDKRVW